MAEMTLELHHCRDASYTRVSIRRTIATVAQPTELLFQVESGWTRAPVGVALCVDGTNSGSCRLELGDDVLRRAHGRHRRRIGMLVSHETPDRRRDDDR